MNNYLSSLEGANNSRTYLNILQAFQSSSKLTSSEELAIEITTQELRSNKSTKWIIYMAISDALASIAYALGPLTQMNTTPSNILCYLQSILINWFELSSVLWAGAIATSLLLLITFPVRNVELAEISPPPEENDNDIELKAHPIDKRNDVSIELHIPEIYDKEIIHQESAEHSSHADKSENLFRKENNTSIGKANDFHAQVIVDKDHHKPRLEVSTSVFMEKNDENDDYDSPTYTLDFLERRASLVGSLDDEERIKRNQQSQMKTSLPPIITNFRTLNKPRQSPLQPPANSFPDGDISETSERTSTVFDLGDMDHLDVAKPSSIKRLGMFILEYVGVIYHLVCFGYPCLMTIIMIFSGVFGDSDGFCWIDKRLDRKTRTIWTMVAFYIPLWICELYIVCIYAIICTRIIRKWCTIRRIFHDSNSITRQNLIVIFKLSLYPTILLLAYIFPTTNRIFQLFGETQFWLLLLHTIGSHSVGFLNAVVYGITQKVFSAYFNAFKKVKPNVHLRRKRRSSKKNVENGQKNGDFGLADDDMVDVSLSD